MRPPHCWRPLPCPGTARASRHDYPSRGLRGEDFIRRRRSHAPGSIPEKRVIASQFTGGCARTRAGFSQVRVFNSVASAPSLAGRTGLQQRVRSPQQAGRQRSATHAPGRVIWRQNQRHLACSAISRRETRHIHPWMRPQLGMPFSRATSAYQCPLRLMIRSWVLKFT